MITKTVMVCPHGDERDHAAHTCHDPVWVEMWTEPGWTPPARPARGKGRLPDAPPREPVFDHVGQVENRNARILASAATKTWSATGYLTGYYGCTECGEYVKITNDLVADAFTECKCGGPWGPCWKPVESQFYVGPGFAAIYEKMTDGKWKMVSGYVLEVEENAWKPAGALAVVRRAKECNVA